jgi:predicted phage terminase large subunit-like protein
MTSATSARTYSASWLALQPLQERQAFLESLTPSELAALQYDWRFWARDKQLPPDGDDWFVWLLLSGRGFGKTWVGSNYVIEHARNYPQWPIAIIGQTKADARDTMVELGDSSIMRQSPPDFLPHYEPSKRRITWPNGATAIIYSGDEPGQLRGPQHGMAWVDELAKMKYPDETWDNLEFGLRLGPRPHVIVTTTPRPVPIIKALLKDSAARMATGSTFENAANLPKRFLDRLLDKYEGTRLGRQELYAEILEDVPGALWTRNIIEAGRQRETPGFVRVVVAIDPAVTAGDKSDETGIIVCGLDEVGHAYVIDDLSGRFSPETWAGRAVRAYHQHSASCVVAEVNNGGDLVRSVVRNVDAKVAYQAVRASRGKYTRAEPVAQLYEQGKVHHVGVMPELEDQLCTWIPGDKSPDRMDALVWGLTNLMLTAGVRKTARSYQG